MQKLLLFEEISAINAVQVKGVFYFALSLAMEAPESKKRKRKYCKCGEYLSRNPNGRYVEQYIYEIHQKREIETMRAQLSQTCTL